MTPDELRQQIAGQVEAYLKSGGTITQADSSFNKDANTRFRDTSAGPRYVDKSLAAERQNTHNKVKRKRK